MRVSAAAESGCGDGSEPVGVATAVTGSAGAGLMTLDKFSPDTLSLMIREGLSIFGFGPGFLRWRLADDSCGGAAMVLEDGDGEREPEEEDVLAVVFAIVVLAVVVLAVGVEEVVGFVVTIVLCGRL